VNLNYARIYSPVNGVVNTKLTDVGETASPGVALMNLVSLDRVYFEALVSENNIARVKTGQPATITVAALGNRKFRGFVSDVIPTADPRLRQFRLRITIPGASQQLTPGAFARGTVDTATVYNALLVPDDAIKTGGERPHLFLAVGSGNAMQVKRRNVAVGISNGGKTQIVGGVQRGDKVIITDELLDDGEKVRAAKAA
jgi:RND family efflux transporter MFP subunit